MKINKKCNFVLENVYEYDFEKCHYNLLKLYGHDMSEIPEDDKITRNIKIGKIRKNNKEISDYLQNETTRLIDYYLEANEVNVEKEMIVRLFDGMVLTRKLKDVSSDKLKLELKNNISKFIISVDRKMFIKIINDGEVIVKGVVNKPVDDGFYKLFKNLTINDKKVTIDYLDNIRYKIFHGDCINWYIRKSEDGEFLIPILNEGIMKVNKSMLSMFKLEDVDKKYIWNNYIWPFVKSVLINMNSYKKT